MSAEGAEGGYSEGADGTSKFEVFGEGGAGFGLG